MKICDYTVKQLKDICDKYYNACSDCNKDCPFLKLGDGGCIRSALNKTVLIETKILDKELDIPIKDTDKSDEKETVANKCAHANLGCENENADYNVYGSKLEDIQEINRLKDENLELKLIIGDMQLKIFKLAKELKEKD